ncbi:uncharacterized protein LOC100889276 [Strongylocentrotus purpuratus]|uniref:C-type lectin domain-containing protein n=1 Tax=Strongylocentrotus purpuratus TaxID=7668 RepID=A0A7M7GFJ8_STRPU|nr:uncharacterized protein LOC100889276 [Strongylocentrotus purpuratus]
MRTILPVLVLLCLAAVLVDATDNEVVACAKDWFHLHPTSGKCLLYVRRWYSWQYARWFCYWKHSTLFYPENENELTAAHTELDANDGSSAWLGVCKVSNGDFITSDNQDYSNIWTGTTGLTDSSNPVGYLEIRSTTPAFQYSYSSWYWYPKKRRFICGVDACRINCDRLCALIEAFETLCI